MNKKYIVKVVHEFVVEASDEQEAENIVIAKNGYGEAKDCYLEVNDYE